MNEERSSFPWLLLISIVAVIAAVGVFSAFPFLRMFPGIFLAARNIRKQEAQMQTPQVYQPIARALAIYCQTGPEIFPTGFVGNAWLPKPVRALEPNMVNISGTNALVGIGGGFVEFFGYRLELDTGRVAPGSNFWHTGIP
jgi:hypothetical protein